MAKERRVGDGRRGPRSARGRAASSRPSARIEPAASEEIIELPPEERGLTSAEEPIIEFDPRAREVRAAAVVRAAEPTSDTLPVDADWFEARDALSAWLDRGQREVAPRSVRADERASRVLGVGIGFKRTGDTLTGDIAVKVYVVEKLPEGELAERLVVPSEVDGYPTDVDPIGEVVPQSYAFHYDRPVRCGVSVGHRAVSAGTLGCLVVLENNHLAILSNNHVLANANNAKSGDAILQAGVADGGAFPQDTLGVLETFIPISGTTTNLVDAAVAHTSFRHVDPRHVTYTLDPRPIAPVLGMTVIKNGRTTQATIGTITEVGVNLSVPYAGIGPAPFKDQLGIRGVGGVFSRPGDSGSLIVTANSKQPLALLFAGTADNALTLANPIAEVMQALRIKRFVDKRSS